MSAFSSSGLVVGLVVRAPVRARVRDVVGDAFAAFVDFVAFVDVTALVAFEDFDVAPTRVVVAADVREVVSDGFEFLVAILTTIRHECRQRDAVRDLVV